jgi:YbgC/YbaW family acyl-CoA thioester hydrolase
MTSRVTAAEIVVRSTDLGSDQYVRGEMYFTYFEQSRLEHLRRLDIVPVFPPPVEAPNYFAIVETTARYREAAHFGDVLTVVTTTAAVSNRTFTLAFEIRRSGTDAPITEGRSVQVWLDADRRPAPIPAALRARLEASIPAGG